MATAETPSLLDRFLRLFTDVRAGEGVTALLLSSNVFLLLSSYYILKSIRDGLILAGSGAEVKAYTSALQVVVLAGVVPLYGRLADRLPRRKLINLVTLAFAASFVGLAGIVVLGFDIGVVFFVWVSVFAVMIMAQFWSFANDLYTRQDGERLFPLVAFGQSLGAVVGATYAAQLAAPFGIPNLVLAAVVMLVGALAITNYIDNRERRLKESHLPPEQTTAVMVATRALKVQKAQRMLRHFTGEPEPEDDEAAVGAADLRAGTGAKRDDDKEPDPVGSFALVLGTRYLLMIGFLMLLLNFVNTTGGYILDRLLVEAAERMTAAGEAGGLTQGEFLTAYYGSFYQIVNLTGLIMQLFLVSRVVKYLGVAVGLMILPLISLGAYGLIGFYPVLSYVRWAKTAENATDYSLNNTVRNMLFLPTTREQKYKAKQAIDSFFWRTGDMMSALLVLVGTTMLALSTSGFALVNIGAVVVWLVLAYRIGMEYKRLIATGETPR
jgi:AAA family ATP:ADP antiporter